MHNRIKQIRNTAGLSQSDFAQKLNLSRNYIGLIEIGQREPSERTINDICRVFGVNPIWLRTGVGEPFTPLSRSEELAAIFATVQVSDDAKSRLIKAMARMPDDAFPALLDFIRKLATTLSEDEEL